VSAIENLKKRNNEKKRKTFPGIWGCNMSHESYRPKQKVKAKRNKKGEKPAASGKSCSMGLTLGGGPSREFDD